MPKTPHLYIQFAIYYNTWLVHVCGSYLHVARPFFISQVPCTQKLLLISAQGIAPPTLTPPTRSTESIGWIKHRLMLYFITINICRYMRLLMCYLFMCVCVYLDIVQGIWHQSELASSRMLLWSDMDYCKTVHLIHTLDSYCIHCSLYYTHTCKENHVTCMLFPSVAEFWQKLEFTKGIY